MKGFIYKLFLMLFSANCFGQNIQVLSKTDNDEVPYVNIMYLKNDSLVGGTYTDENGKVMLKLQSEVNFISLSCLGYGSIKIPKEAITDTIYLEEDIKELEEVTLNSPKNKKSKLKKLGYPVKYKYFSVTISQAFECIIFIENTFDKKKNIKYFSFYLLRWNEIQEDALAFRLVCYTSKNYFPNKSYLKDSKDNIFIIKPNQKNKIKLDISGLNITLPKEGFFIGLEYIGTVDTKTNQIIYSDANDMGGVEHPSISFIKVKNMNMPQAYERRKFNPRMRDWISIIDNKKLFFSDLEPKENEYYVPAFGIEVYE